MGESSRVGINVVSWKGYRQLEKESGVGREEKSRVGIDVVSWKGCRQLEEESGVGSEVWSWTRS